MCTFFSGTSGWAVVVSALASVINSNVSAPLVEFSFMSCSLRSDLLTFPLSSFTELLFLPPPPPPSPSLTLPPPLWLWQGSFLRYVRLDKNLQIVSNRDMNFHGFPLVPSKSDEFSLLLLLPPSLFSPSSSSSPPSSCCFNATVF